MPRTRTYQSKSTTQETRLPREVVDTVENRGFYLYNWISSEEFRLSFKEDYLTAIANLNTPFLIIALVSSAIGFYTALPLAFIFALGVFGVMYALIFGYLFYKAIQKGSLYAKGSNVTLTDTHLVAGDMVRAYTDNPEKSELIKSLEVEFDEKLFGTSNIEQKIEKRKQTIKEKLGTIVQITTEVGKSGNGKQLGNIMLILGIVGIIYGAIFGLVYYFGLFFVNLIALGYASIIDKVMRWKQKTEYQIQKSFSEIDTASSILQEESGKARGYLSEAINNQWMNNLSKRIDTSFKKINTSANTAIETHKELKEILLNSKYKEIFSFEKYENWIKGQIVEPLKKTISLLETNKNILQNTIESIDGQIESLNNPDHITPLKAQKSRLKIQLETTEKTLQSLQNSLNSLL